MKTKKPSRILSLVLSAVMVLAMLPAVGLKAEAAAIVTRTTPLDLATNADITYIAANGSTSATANPTLVSIQDTGEGWSWDLASKTLTLSGATIDCSANNVAEEVFGLQLPLDATVVLAPDTTNTVKAGNSYQISSVGVKFTGGNSAISGKGTLNVTSGSANVASVGIRSFGGTLTLREATIVAATSKTSNGVAIHCTNDPSTLRIQSGTITATGITNDPVKRGIGIDATTTTISGGTVTAIGTGGSGVGGGSFTMTGGTLSASGTPSAIKIMTPITAAGAIVTGAKETFASGTTQELTQSGADPVTIKLGPPPPATFNAVYDVAGGSGSRLERSLDVVVNNTNEGIIAADKADGNNVSLKLTVTEKATVSVPDSEKIEGVKQGDSLQYYDVKVEKIVTTSDGTPTTTVLTSIPKPVQAIIPVPLAIQGKTSYTVYRVHGGVAEQIPNDPTAAEFYTVDAGGKNLTLNVRQFSTYAVITNNKSLTGDHTFGDATNPKNSAVDVQGKVIEGNFGVYKLDISWGAMKFDYNAQGKVWNPVTHVYDANAVAKGWIKESFDAPNNKITVANHSNGDVWLSYLAKPDAVLAGTTMTVRSTNSLQSVEAKDVLLGKVAAEGGTVPTVDTFVWLTGDPTTLTSKTYTKAGVITITAEPDKTGALTPKKP